MFTVVTGADGKAAAGRIAVLWATGLVGEIKPLNGGSDTRRGMIEAAAERAAILGHWLEARSFEIKRQAAPLRTRGLRHMRIDVPGCRVAFHWVHWRRAKRLYRKGKAKPVMATKYLVLVGEAGHT